MIFGSDNYKITLIGNIVAAASQGLAFPIPSILAMRFFEQAEIAVIIGLPPI